jgi:HEPN superfamily RiboL-PSP-like protein
MPSKARKAFDQNIADIERLLEIHDQSGGTGAGRRYRLEVLNKSAIVLLTAFWEAYCEDIAAEALAHIVKFAKMPDTLPEELRRQLAKEIKNIPHELEIWKLAGNGWRPYLTTRLERLRIERNRDLNTPKSARVERLFSDAIGLAKVSNAWKWSGMNPKRASSKLDRYVELRGDIAHRGQHSSSVKKSHVRDYFKFIEQLAGKTGGAVNRHVKQITGKRLWT